MAVNKVEANGETLIDLTNDTVTADTLVEGRTAHLASGEQVTGSFKPITGVKGNAETTYRTGNVNLTPANIGAVNKAGDTMSGPLTHNGAGTILKNTNLDVNGDNPTSNTWSNAPIEYHDKDNARMGFVNVQRRTDGSTMLEIGAQARNTADTADIYNTIDMLVGRDGTRSYAVTDPTAFRKAIGTGNQVALTGAVTGTGTFDSNGNVASVGTTLNPELSGQINYNTNNGVKNLLSTEWFATKPNSLQRGTVESYDVETGSVTGFASASQTGAYLSIDVNSNWCNQFLEDGKTYILSWIVDSRTNNGVFGFRRADNNAYSVGGSATINRTGTYTTTYTHNASIPVYFSFCINTAGTSSDKRIVISNLMLREATIEDSTFEPYAKSNAELTSGKLDATGNESTPYDRLPEHFELWTTAGGNIPNGDMFIKMLSDTLSARSHLLLGNDYTLQYFGIERDRFVVQTKDANSMYEFKDDGIYLNGTRIAP